jgi:hypothetical protein
MTCQFCNPVADEVVRKERSLVFPLGPQPIQQGAPAHDPIPRHMPDYFLMTGEENLAVPALADA